jgi:hypothetical protein
MAPLPASTIISRSIKPEPLRTISDPSTTTISLLAAPIRSPGRRFRRALSSICSPRTPRLIRTFSRAWTLMHHFNSANRGKIFFLGHDANLPVVFRPDISSKNHRVYLISPPSHTPHSSALQKCTRIPRLIPSGPLNQLVDLFSLAIGRAALQPSCSQTKLLSHSTYPPPIF